MQLVFNVRKRFKCRLQNTEWGIYKSAIIRENAIHQLNSNNSVLLIIYLDAESEIAKTIKLKYLQDSDICSPDMDIFNIIKPGDIEQCLIEPNSELLEQIINQLLNELVDKKPMLSDERVTTVLHLLTTGHSEEMTVS